MSTDQSPGVGVWLCVAVFLAGLIAGPGYFIYCTGYTGRLVSELEIRPQDRGRRSGSVQLDPAMNPLRVQVDATVSGWKDETPAEVDVSVYDGRTALVQVRASFSMTEDREKRGVVALVPTTRDSNRLNTFSVPRAGSYQLQAVVTQRGGKAVAISEPVVKLVGYTRVPNMKIVWSGVAVAVISALLAWMLMPARP